MLIISDNRPVNIIIRYKDKTQKNLVGYEIDDMDGLLEITLASGATYTEDSSNVKTILFHGRTAWTGREVQ